MAITVIPAGDALAALLDLSDEPISDGSAVVVFDTDTGEVFALTGKDAAGYRDLIEPDDSPRIHPQNSVFLDRYR